MQHLHGRPVVELSVSLDEGEVGSLGEDGQGAHRVGVRLELEVPEAGYEGTCCDQGYGGYEEG